ncbi:tail fiber domain-containing protein [Dyadobacter sp. 22481]|uniref:tail fiber domain-containing protein n=1 Tax=Dyadobacter sp. 22481 TaxID=3453926 RepID=UPI003F83150F
MKTKQLRSTKTITSALFAAAMLFSSASVFAQVKIGSNPTTITPNANLDVEGVSNRHTVVMKTGHVGIGTITPGATLTVRAVQDLDLPFARNIVALFDPVGGNNFDSTATIGVNGGRALFGYEVDGQQGKYAFLRGNQATDIRLQVVDANSVLYPNPLVISARPTILGFIGINNEFPQSQLDVRGTTKILPTSAVQTGSIWNGTSNMSGFEVINNPNGDAFVGIQRTQGLSANLHLGKAAGAAVNSAFLAYYVNGASVGGILYNGAGVNYVTTSDQRLKENIRTTKFGLEALKTVKVYDYNFKADQTKSLSTGVLAQELHKVYPQAVTVGGADAKTNPWQVDYSKLVPMLVKSVQELNQTVESLNQKVGSLESEKAQLSAELNERVNKLERLLSTGEHVKSLSSTSPPSGSVGK